MIRKSVLSSGCLFLGGDVKVTGAVAFVLFIKLSVDCFCVINNGILY